MKKSLFGLEENHVSALSYVLTFVTGLIVLVLEKENKNVRFHAMQSTLLGLAAMILNFALRILSIIPLLGILASLANSLVGIALVAAVIYMILNALKGQTLKLPIIGDIAWEQVNK